MPAQDQTLSPLFTLTERHTTTRYACEQLVVTPYFAPAIIDKENACTLNACVIQFRKNSDLKTASFPAVLNAIVVEPTSAWRSWNEAEWVPVLLERIKRCEMQFERDWGKIDVFTVIENPEIPLAHLFTAEALGTVVFTICALDDIPITTGYAGQTRIYPAGDSSKSTILNQFAAIEGLLAFMYYPGLICTDFSDLIQTNGSHPRRSNGPPRVAAHMRLRGRKRKSLLTKLEAAITGPLQTALGRANCRILLNAASSSHKTSLKDFHFIGQLLSKHIEETCDIKVSCSIIELDDLLIDIFVFGDANAD